MALFRSNRGMHLLTLPTTHADAENTRRKNIQDGELPVLLIMCGFLQGASYSGVPPVFVLSSLFRPMAPSRIPQKNAGRFF